MNIFIYVFFALLLLIVLILTIAFSVLHLMSNKRYYLDKEHGGLSTRFSINVYIKSIRFTQYSCIMLGTLATIALAVYLAPIIGLKYSLVALCLVLFFVYPITYYYWTTNTKNTLTGIILKGEINRSTTLLLEAGYTREDLHDVFGDRVYNMAELEAVLLKNFEKIHISP